MTFAGITRHDRRRLRASLLPALFTVLLGMPACVQAQESAVTAPNLPAGAIATGDELYMVPIAEDDIGCMQYRMYSPTKAVAQVIFYRAPDGSFTADRSKAACAKKP